MINQSSPANRAGEYHEDEVLEVAPGDVFEKCVFIRCAFNCVRPFGFRDCEFVGSPTPFNFAREGAPAFIIHCVFSHA